MSIEADELNEDAALASGTEDHLAAMRHSAAHMMAAAVMELFPEAKLGIGPAIKDGFYYDFDLPRPLTPADLEQIEAKMREQQAAGLAFERSRDLPRAEACRARGARPAVQGRDRQRPAGVGRPDRLVLPAR
jgi:threonyl-tRNA synthetase